MASSKMVQKWRSQVIAAVYEDDFKQLNELMKSTCTQSDGGVDVNFTDVSGFSPLLIAVQNKKVNIIRLLFSHGGNFHATPGYHSKIMDLYAAVHKLEASLLGYPYEDFDYGYKHTLVTLLYGSGIEAAIHDDHCDIVKHILEHCEALPNRFLPLGLLFNFAMVSCSPGIAILLLLQHGYYPITNPSQFYIACFQAGARLRARVLVKILANLNPQFLQEQWLIEKQLPLSYGGWLSIGNNHQVYKNFVNLPFLLS